MSVEAGQAIVSEPGELVGVQQPRPRRGRVRGDLLPAAFRPDIVHRDE